MKKLKDMSKKQLITLGTVGIIALSGVSGVGYKVYADKQTEVKIEKALQKEGLKNAELSEMDKKILALYQNEVHDFLANDVTVEGVTQLEETVSKLTKTTYDVKSPKIASAVKQAETHKAHVMSELKEIESKAEKQEKVNALFQKDKAINGKTVNDQLVIIDDLSKDKLPDAKDFKEKTAWHKAMFSIINNVNNQLTQIETAKKAVAELFDKKVVSKKATDKGADKAANEVKKIKNAKAKKDLESQLKKVTDELKKRAKVEADKKVAVTPETPNNELNQTGTDNQAEKNETTDNEANWETGSNTDNNGSSTNNGSTGNTWTPPASNGNNGGGNTNTPNPEPTPTPKPPEEVVLVSGTIGNGPIFSTYEAAVDWTIAKRNENIMNGSGAGSSSISTLFYSDGSEKFSPNFVAG